MRTRVALVFAAPLVMVLTSLQAPVAFAQEQRDPNEGEPKHEINERQNRLHRTCLMVVYRFVGLHAFTLPKRVGAPIRIPARTTIVSALLL